MEDACHSDARPFLGGNAYAEKKAWVSYADSTLTFHYGEKENVNYENEFWLSNYPTWRRYSGEIKTVVFEESFKDARPTSCKYWFQSCVKLTTIEGVQYLNTSEVTTMQQMFSGCSDLTTLDLSGFDTQKVTDMSQMFEYCNRLTSLDLSNCSNEELTNMSYMFNGCKSLSTLDLSSFNTQSVTNMASMFFSCSSLTSLDLSSFDTRNVSQIYQMFYNCNKLETIYASKNFVVNANSSNYSMFYGCNNLIGDIAFNGTYDATYAKVNGGYFSDKQYTRPWVKYADGVLSYQYGYKEELGSEEYELKLEKNDFKWREKANEITKIIIDSSFGKVVPTTCSGWFNDFPQLKTIEGIEYFVISNFKTMNDMFSGCSNLTTLDLSSFDTQNVTDMSRMFKGCSQLSTLDLSNFKTQGVGDMTEMFSGCSNLAQIYASEDFILKDDLLGDNMFDGCTNLKGGIEYEEGKVDKNYARLEDGYFLISPDAKPWVQFTNGTLTFQMGTKKTLQKNQYWLNEEKAYPGWNQVANAITKVMFAKSFSNARPTSCYYWFYNCRNLTQIEGIQNLNTSEVTNMGNMFANCIKLTTLDVSGFKTTNATDLSSMFYGCQNLTQIEGIQNLNTSEVTNMRNMFANCTNLNSLDVSNFDTQNVTDMSGLFKDCNKLTTLDVSGFKTTNATDLSGMFYCCQNLKSLDVSGFDTKNVKNFNGIFQECKNLKSLDVSKFKTAKATDLSSMFFGCQNLKSLDLSNFDTKLVTNMTGMFNECKNLKSLDLSNFDTKMVEEMAFTFSETDNLEAIYFGDAFSVENLESIYRPDIFADCPATLYCSPLQYESFKNNSVIASYGNAVKPYVSINSRSKYGTLCVPVGSSLAEGSYTGFDNLYKVTNADKDKGTITLAEAKSIEPGVPYVYHRYLEGVDFESETEESSSDNDSSDETSSSETLSVAKAPVMSVITFDVDENASSAVTAPKNENSLLKGTFESMYALGGSYILQTDGNFHPVAADNKTLKLGAYRAYLDLNSVGEGGAEIGAKAYQMVFEDGEATGIDRINGEGSDKGVYDQADHQPKVYFDLMGRKVTAPQKGEIYIVNGKKVVYNK